MTIKDITPIYDAGKAFAKAELNIRAINQKAVECINTLGITLGDKDKIDELRYEYVTGALVGGRRYTDSRARYLADGKNAKERSDEDKSVLNAAGVNWMRIRERAGLKTPSKPKGDTAAPARDAGEPNDMWDAAKITIVPVSDTQALLGLFEACHSALLKTVNASASALKGDAASILRAALVDLGNACEDAAMSLATDVSAAPVAEIAKAA